MQSRDLALAIAKVIALLGLDSGMDLGDLDFRVVVQKVGYIIQKLGCDMGLRFSWYPLGPYSKSLQNHYGFIAKVLVGFKNGSVDVELPKDVAPCIERTVSFLTELKKAIGRLDVESLEVLASLVMLCSEIYPKPSDPVEELLARKRGVSEGLVKAIWEFLVNKNMCI